MISGIFPAFPTHAIPSPSQFDFSSIQQGNSPRNIFEEALDWWKRTVQSMQHPNPLKVKKMSDDSGHDLWYAYDPLTGKTKWAETEGEVVQWIEDNYLGR